MDKIRSAAADLARRAARSRPVAMLAGMPCESSSRDSERGQGLAEYALILAGIAIVAIASLVFLGSTITGLFWAPIDAEFGRILTDVIGIGGG